MLWRFASSEGLHEINLSLSLLIFKASTQLSLKKTLTSDPVWMNKWKFLDNLKDNLGKLYIYIIIIEIELVVKSNWSDIYE